MTDQNVCADVRETVARIMGDEFPSINHVVTVDPLPDPQPGDRTCCAVSFDVGGERKAVLSWIEPCAWSRQEDKKRWIHDLISTMRAAIALYQGEAEKGVA